MRVLYVARYRNVQMERKIALMAAYPDLQIWLVRPTRWRDEYGSSSLPESQTDSYYTLAVTLIGRPTDHHRVLYGTLGFGMRTVQPDVIHAEEEPDSLAALQITVARQVLARRAKLVLHTWQNINRPKGIHVWAVIRATLGRADAVLCASREAVTVLGELGYAGTTDLILQEGVNFEVFRPEESETLPDQFTVVYAGRLAVEKGIDVLLDAARQLGSEVRVLLVGEGPDRARLASRVRTSRLEDKVTFVGPVSAEQMPRILRGCHALVLPSRTTPKWKEQFGRVLVEAMACKVPVVGSDSGAIPEVIGDAGLVFPEGDAEALAGCLQRLRDSPILRTTLSARGYERARQMYSQEHIADQTVGFYRRLLGP